MSKQQQPFPGKPNSSISTKVNDVISGLKAASRSFAPNKGYTNLLRMNNQVEQSSTPQISEKLQEDKSLSDTRENTQLQQIDPSDKMEVDTDPMDKLQREIRKGKCVTKIFF